MTKVFIGFIGLFVMGFSGLYALGNREMRGEIIRGNGDRISYERPVSPFTGIELNTAYNHNGRDGKGTLRIHSGQEYRLSISVDQNLDEYIETTNEGDKLTIELKRRIAEDFIVDVYCPNILEITVNNMVQRVEFVDKMITPSLKIIVNGVAGRVLGELECDNFSVVVNGAVDIEITGSSKEAYIAINGAGNFDGYEFEINNGAVFVNGAGNVRCWVVDNLTVGLAGVGNIRYRGDPYVKMSKRGLGSIRKV
ncbi:MAG: DUF2807 domain-containing protein [Treponema sp.]|jgi:hypothetical protein|nr:DUF2807 domain-containing protein [Treponema sp.]